LADHLAKEVADYPTITSPPDEFLPRIIITLNHFKQKTQTPSFKNSPTTSTPKRIPTPKPILLAMPKGKQPPNKRGQTPLNNKLPHTWFTTNSVQTSIIVDQEPFRLNQQHHYNTEQLAREEIPTEYKGNLQKAKNKTAKRRKIEETPPHTLLISTQEEESQTQGKTLPTREKEEKQAAATLQPCKHHSPETSSRCPTKIL